MKVKVKRVVTVTMDESECSIMLDGLLAVANDVAGPHPGADRDRAQAMHDKLRNAWRTS